MPFVAFIESHQPHGDEGGGTPDPWVLRVLDWAFPWPATIVWLCAAGMSASGWLGVALIYLAVGLAAWRGLRSIPSDGLEQDHQ